MRGTLTRFLLFFVLGSALAGCRQAERLAWTADARQSTLTGWNGPRTTVTGEAGRM